MRKTIVRLVKMIFICAIVAIPFTGCGTKKVSVNDYFEYEVKGYNGRAYIDDSFHLNQLEQAVLAASKYDENDMESMSIYAAVDNAVKYSWNKKEDLSNGDEVVLTWTIDNSSLKKARVKLVGEDIKIKVNGLEDIETFDPFDYFEPRFSGTSPRGKVEFYYSTSEPAMEYISFTAKKTSSLSNGEKITVTANPDMDLDSFAEKFGKIPSETEKEIEVVGLPEYVTVISEIPENAIKNMNDRAVESIKEDIDSFWDNPGNLSNIEYAGLYLYTEKDGINFSPYNMIVIIDKISVAGDDPFEYYFATTFNNGYIKPDGNFFIDLNDYELCGQTENIMGMFTSPTGASFVRNNLSYNGYSDIETLKEHYDSLYSTEYDYRRNF